MDDTLRKALRTATQNARQLLENEFSEQLEGRFDIRPDGTIPEEAGPHLDASERVLRQKLVTAIKHKVATGKSPQEAVTAFLREAAFTMLNRFAALKMLEVRDLVQECISNGDESSGFNEFAMLAPGLSDLPDNGYRLYIESLFDEIGQEIRILFDRQEVAGMLWPRRQALLDLLDILNQRTLVDAWRDPEAIGWVYQYFNSSDERQEMRSESSTPRNSHELAVRNQFFTPDYVVQFLTDNSLGRTWYEMQKGKTQLTETCKYFAERPDEVFLSEGEVPPKTDGEAEEDSPTYIPHRDKKDPRALRVLDPACGSGHFLLYTFDLLWAIYEEAWKDPEGPAFEETGNTLSGDYPTLDALHRALPGLILEHNLYGVDIDPRATQIAAFALWMRAQQTYNDIGIDRGSRPAITKTNVVVAEPMPGDEELRTEFIDSLQPAALGELVEVVFDRMQLADEAGTLLRIEEEIRGAIQDAKDQWEKPQQLELMPEETRKEFRQSGLFDVSNISDAEFWTTVEDQIYQALQRYAERGEQQEGLRRRLFADDATAGFAFIDICRQRYDVVLMNPPFGDPAESTKGYIEDHYPNSKSDILQAFVERAEEHLQPAGYLGAITSRTSLFLSSAQSWRERVVLRRYRPYLLADFGMGVLDAMVETAAYVFRAINGTEERALTQELLPDLKRAETNSQGKFSVPKYMDARSDDLKRHQAERELERLLKADLIADASGRYAQYRHRADEIRRIKDEDLISPAAPLLTCYRLLETDDKSQALLKATGDRRGRRCFRADPDTFSDVPGAPFAYWVSNRVRHLFQELPPLESSGRVAKQGLATADDFRFVRCWWEVSGSERCPPEVHPGEWKGPYCVRDAEWVPLVKGSTFSQFYSDFCTVIKWRKHGREVEAFSNSYIRNPNYYFRPGLTFSSRARRFSTKPVARGAVFTHTGFMLFAKEEDLEWTSAYLSSNIMRSILGLLAPPRKNEIGYVQQLPTPASIDAGKNEELSSAREVGIRESQRRMAMEPTNLNFQRLGQLTERDRAEMYPEDAVDNLVCEILGLSESEKQDLLRQLGVVTGLVADQERFSSNGHAEGSDRDFQPEKQADERAHDLISYVLGCAFGRWDVRYATGEKEGPDLPDPFDPLPVCPPGMLTGEDGLPLNEAPDSYPLPDVLEDGILVDDPGHERDVMSWMRAALRLMFEDEAAAEREACELLDESDLRSYFRKTTGFFKAHRKQYSKSRRKAPIYWQLAPSSADYSVWLYYPKLTEDTFYRVLDVVKEKIRHEERQLADLREESGATPNATQRDNIADQEDFVSELRGFRKEIERVAPLWNPNMNDGVVINYAPLWRLVQHNRTWQKECKKHWDRLVEGEYDWSHWAMHLWPERVVPKCAERRDLAIAHDLEDVFWTQDAEGDWVARDEPTQPVDELIEERTSRTVKSALKDLVDAPSPR